MITLERPNMAINDPRKGCRYQMWNTWDIQENEKSDHILGWTRTVAKGAPAGKLKNLVINCHGLPGFLQLGEGLDFSNVGQFAMLRGKVDNIWLASVCFVAESEPNGVDGNLFVSTIAQLAKCYVIASSADQTFRQYTYPPDKIDRFEGLVMTYAPTGEIISTVDCGDWAQNRE